MFLMILPAGCADSLVVKPGTPGDSAEVAGPPSADTADTAETGAAESAPADTVSAETAESVPPDGDGDGFTADEDCDDADATVSPGALEECDGRDDDCDGLVDDADSDVTGAPVWYRDADADGFGDSAGSVSSCSPPPGYVAVASDCDDSEAAVNPASTEVCDGLDNDCDALNDGRDPGCTDVTTWYADTDGDGYGDPADSRIACDGHGGWVTNGLDCDDTDPTLTTTCGGESTACSADGTAVACGGTFQCLDLCDAVNVDHTDGPWTGDPSESFDVAPGTVAWTTADRTVVPFLILDPAANEARSMIASRGGEDWRPSYGFPERFEIPGGGASGSRIHLAGLAGTPRRTMPAVPTRSASTSTTPTDATSTLRRLTSSPIPSSIRSRWSTMRRCTPAPLRRRLSSCSRSRSSRDRRWQRSSPRACPPPLRKGSRPAAAGSGSVARRGSKPLGLTPASTSRARRRAP